MYLLRMRVCVRVCRTCNYYYYRLVYPSSCHLFHSPSRTIAPWNFLFDFLPVELSYSNSSVSPCQMYSSVYCICTDSLPHTSALRRQQNKFFFLAAIPQYNFFATLISNFIFIMSSGSITIFWPKNCCRIRRIVIQLRHQRWIIQTGNRNRHVFFF